MEDNEKSSHYYVTSDNKCFVYRMSQSWDIIILRSNVYIFLSLCLRWASSDHHLIHIHQSISLETPLLALCIAHFVWGRPHVIHCEKTYLVQRTQHRIEIIVDSSEGRLVGVVFRDCVPWIEESVNSLVVT